MTLTDLPSSVGFAFCGGDIRITLPDEAATQNMQTDNAAFEGWSTILHTISGKNIILDIASDDWDKNAGKNPGHYNRFLYRLMKFSASYSFVTLSGRLQKHIGCLYVDNAYVPISDLNLVVNRPKKEAGSNEKNEIRQEEGFASKPEKLLAATRKLLGVDLIDSVYRQLPVGIFRESSKEENSVFTGKASAIDLWSLTKARDGIVIYELKYGNNRKVGIISELFFYANLVYDIYGSDPNFGIDKSLTDIKRGYNKLLGLKKLDRIYVIFLTMGLHPAITPDVIKSINTPFI